MTDHCSLLVVECNSEEISVLMLDTSTLDIHRMAEGFKNIKLLPWHETKLSLEVNSMCHAMKAVQQARVTAP